MEIAQSKYDELRIDGRRPVELRKINLRLGVFRQADGSAYVEQGKTKALVAVYGPHQVYYYSYVIYYVICKFLFQILSHLNFAM